MYGHYYTGLILFNTCEEAKRWSVCSDAMSTIKVKLFLFFCIDKACVIYFFVSRHLLNKETIHAYYPFGKSHRHQDLKQTGQVDTRGRLTDYIFV